MNQGKAAISDFAGSAGSTFEPLNQGLSDTAINALKSAQSLDDLRNTLNLLIQEQSDIAEGTQQWQQYQIAIVGLQAGIGETENQLHQLSDTVVTAGGRLQEGESCGCRSPLVRRCDAGTATAGEAAQRCPGAQRLRVYPRLRLLSPRFDAGLNE